MLRYILIGLAALLLLLAVAWWWLTGTRSGAAFLLGQAQSRLEKLEYGALEGGLSKGIVLRDVEFEQAGLGLSAGRLELAVGIRPLPTRVTIRRLALADVELRLPPAAPEQPEAAPFQMGDYTAPVEVVIEDFELIDFTLHGAAGDSAPMEIQRAAFAGRYDEALEIDSLALDMAPYSVSADGRLDLASPWNVDLDLEALWAVEDDASQALSAEVEGPLDALEIQLAGSGPLEARARAAIDGLPATESLSGSISLSGSLEDWPGMAGRIEGVELEGRGSLAEWEAELKGRVEWPEQPAVDVTLAAAGTEDRITISRGDLALLDGHVRVTGSAGLGDPVTADARLALENLDFTAMYPEWPSQARLSGGLEARWDGQVLRVADIELRAPPSPLTLTGNGSLNSSSEALAVQLEWASLVWPPVLGDAEPMFSSESGRLDASGTLDEWRAELEAWMTAPEQPRARVELEADGNAEAMRIRSGRVTIDAGGEIGLTGRVGFAGSPTADLNLTLAGLDPGIWVPELPGTVNGDLSLALDQLQPLVASLTINRLGGTLRNQPLAGSGALALNDALVDRADLNVSLGENAVALTSDGGDAWQLELRAGRLGQLWPDLTGELSMDASFNPGSKTLDWTLESPGVAWLDLRAAQIDSEGMANWGQEESIDARINAQDVDLNPWERLGQVEVTLAGNCQRHTLTGYFNGTRATLDLAVGGELPGCLDRLENWTGQIRRMVISDTPLGTWQLDEDMPVRLRDGVVNAGPACLWTPGGTGRLCLNELEGGATGNAAVAFNSVPLDLLLLPMDPVFTLGSDLRGLAQVRWSPAGLQEIDAELLLGPGAARMLEAEEDLIVIRGARLGLHSPQPGALDAALNLRLEAESVLTASASIPDLNTPEAMQLDASADLSLPNLGALNRLVPQLDRLGGRLDGEFRLSGPLASPDFDGRLAISDGRFFNAPLGTRVEQLSLTLEADQAGGRIDGSFVAGEGRAELRGDLDLDAPGGWRGNLALDGDDLRLFDVDWLELTASPDLSLAFQAELLEINGGIDIDRARLGLPPGSEQRVAVSSDVVVEGRTQQDEEAQALPRRDIVGNVRIGLSDDVRFSAAGLETNVIGELNLDWARERTMPTARGTLNLVDGSYRAYGQNLEVTEGQVLFTGNPVTNPTLGIEAVRQIFGDPQVEQAGVRIRGPAQDPEILLFTSPPTSRENALAYILTGADFDHASGQGAFSVGFWVLPNVFVSYGLGLFDTGNVLAARWELSRRWGLRATSGDRDTGADVSFIIDR
ncbi:MAG TPA: translocation/assembly module TamB domain-containing protein [Wenzhouxiangellaceae bacterium]|nr:translocation/assembly module TamB domain-containing protein [Wenzhouxiangellaceae bacterium]